MYHKLYIKSKLENHKQYDNRDIKKYIQWLEKYLKFNICVVHMGG